MSVVTPKADIDQPLTHVGFGPKNGEGKKLRYRLAIAAPALVREVQSLRGASANQPSFPAYVRALTNWLPSNPISKAFF